MNDGRAKVRGEECVYICMCVLIYVRFFTFFFIICVLTFFILFHAVTHESGAVRIRIDFFQNIKSF